MEYRTRTVQHRGLISLILMMGLLILLGITQAAKADTVTYLERSWNGSFVVTVTKSISDYTLIDSNTKELNGWYVVRGNIESSKRLVVTGTANIILEDSARLYLEDGINVAADKTLNIFCQNENTGRLYCEATTNNNAAIGSDYSDSGCGTINIHGGKITADALTNGQYGAGIGGGNGGNGGVITIYGGNIWATGGNGAAGIGAGKANKAGTQGGTIRIFDGDITGRGGIGGAGIGGGIGGGPGNIEISGGKVKAVAGVTLKDGGAGIGSGHKGEFTVPAGKIKISGGTVDATGAPGGAGIGGGNHNDGGEIEITGGFITAMAPICHDSDKYSGAAGIGGGAHGSGGHITISGGLVNATSQYGSAGIGGGFYGSSGTISISGNADVHARAHMYGAGIGSGYKADLAYDKILITGGTVEAIGGTDSAGIGGGDGSSNRNRIEIRNATVQATGFGNGAGIGGPGEDISGGGILIENSTVSAKNDRKGSATTYGAGIGASYPGNAGRIEIISSNVYAAGGSYASGIGGSYGSAESGKGGTVTIRDSIVEAHAKEDGVAAIGAGLGRDDLGTLTIEGNALVKLPSYTHLIKPYAYIIQRHLFKDVIITNRVMLSYDKNGATGGTVPDPVWGKIGESITVSDNIGGLVKAPYDWDGWNTKADGSGTTFHPGDPMTLNNMVELYAHWKLPPVSYMDWDTSSETLVEKTGQEARQDYQFITSSTANLEAGQWYVVKETINNSNRIIVNGTVHLILMDNAVLNATAGITVESGTELILHGQSHMSGTLNATGGENDAGIGGSWNQDGGKVTINGCTVTAQGGAGAAGIGGGAPGVSTGGNGGEVILHGGTITADGGENGAGVGGGETGDNGGTFTIWTGTVTATGGNNAAGIGGGYNCAGGTVTVKGGKVTATGGTNAHGIGNGSDITGTHGNLYVAASHKAYSSAEPITDDKKDSASPTPGQGDATPITIERKQYMLVEPAPHTHDFTYSADGDTITATCKISPCPLPHGQISLTIVKPTKNTYSAGTGFGLPNAELRNLSEFNKETGKSITENEIKYTGRGETHYTESSTAPNDAGTYTAKITIAGVKTAAGENNSVTAQVDYAIAKANPRCETPDNLNAIYGQTLADVELINKDTNTPGTWSWVDSVDTSVGNAGSNVFKVNFTPYDTANFNTITDLYVTISVEKAPNPATVSDKANVIMGGNTVDLSENVRLNGATGSVSYTISGDAHGCSMSGSVLTSGNKTGTVTVNVTVAEDMNYHALDTKTITVTINDKAVQTIIAPDVTTTYNALGAKVNATTTGDGIISYAVKSGSEQLISIDSSGALTISKAGTAIVEVTAAQTQTYAEAKKDVTVTINKAMNPTIVRGTADVKTNSSINLTNNVELNGATGAVTYQLVSGPTDCVLNNSTLQTGTTTGIAIVKVTVAADDNYLESKPQIITVTITNKNTQTITAEDVTATIYQQSQAKVSATTTPGGGTISYAVKPGSESYIDVNSQNGNLTLNKAGKAIVIVTAAETPQYAKATKEVIVTINKADPTANPPTGVTAIYGQTLSELQLINPSGNTSGKWIWTDPDAKVGSAGTKTFYANFIPDDSNYKSVYNQSVTVNVSRAPNPASITTIASVLIGGNTVNLMNNVERNGATGTISFEFPSGSDTKGCQLNNGVLTSGNRKGLVPVKVTIDQDPNYEALESEIFVIVRKKSQVITAEDIATILGTTNVRVNAQVTEPATGGGMLSYAVKSGSEDYIAVDPRNGLLTLKKAGTAFVIVRAEETETYSWEAIYVKVDISSLYIYLAGQDGVWQRGSSTILQFHVQNPHDDQNTFKKFTSIEVDGALVLPMGNQNYETRPGSIFIDLKPAYLETLNNGRHTIRTLFSDGSADASFNVVDQLPPTGDNSFLWLWIGLAAVGLIGIIVLIGKKHPRNGNKNEL